MPRYYGSVIMSKQHPYRSRLVVAIQASSDDYAFPYSTRRLRRAIRAARPSSRACPARSLTRVHVKDRKARLAHRLASLTLIKNWLLEKKINGFSHLHKRAWWNQLINEAELLRGLAGVRPADPRDRKLAGQILEPRSIFGGASSRVAAVLSE